MILNANLSKLGLLLSVLVTEVLGFIFFSPEFKWGLGRRFVSSANMSPEQEIQRFRDPAVRRKTMLYQILITTLLVAHTLSAWVYKGQSLSSPVEAMQIVMCIGVPFFAMAMSSSLWERKSPQYWMILVLWFVVSQTASLYVYNYISPKRGFLGF